MDRSETMAKKGMRPRQATWRDHVLRKRRHAGAGRRGPCARFLADRRGVAAVEFALVLPVMLGIWLGMAEMTFSYGSDKRLALAANTMADLAARQRDLRNDGVFDGIFSGGKAVAWPDGQGTEMTMVLTVATYDADGKTTVAKSRGYNRAGLAEGTPITVTEGLVVAGQEGCLIVASLELTQAVVFMTKVFGTERTLSHTFAYAPRGGRCPTI